MASFRNAITEITETTSFKCYDRNASEPIIVRKHNSHLAKGKFLGDLESKQKMALSKTDWAIGAKVNKTFKTLPPCAYTASRGIERLATFSTLANNVIIEKISAVRLAATGCIFNAEEDFVECTDCGKITLLANLSAVTTFFDVRPFIHAGQCVLVYLPTS